MWGEEIILNKAITSYLKRRHVPGDLVARLRQFARGGEEFLELTDEERWVMGKLPKTLVMDVFCKSRRSQVF